jgi:radical SAM superfamily enzyme YgiQ (UPF0313 family)
VLISTYELGHQPFGLASPAAWLAEAGVSTTCLDLSVTPLDEDAVARAGLVAFYVPMHTATRLAATLVERVKRINSSAHLCFYGLYAPTNQAYLRSLGAGTILGGEFEEGLLALVTRLSQGVAAGRDARQPEPVVSMAKQAFRVPDRRGLPLLGQYARVVMPDGEHRVAGYTEATRGCRHLCRHCPIPPVYDGVLRVIPLPVVLEDIALQVEAGAQHITLGDPDFFNGPGHALRLVEALHHRFAGLTYDVTIKVEHLLTNAARLPVLRDTGCLFVTSAVESIDDQTLRLFAKGHTRADVVRAVGLCRELGLALNPTFVAFTPWTTLQGYLDLLAFIRDFDLVANVAPIQYGLRLLIPAGSLLLTVPAVAGMVGAFDQAAICYPWSHPDPRVEGLAAAVLAAVDDARRTGESRAAIFQRIWRLACEAYESSLGRRAGAVDTAPLPDAAPIPHLSEPWYC